MRVFQLAGKQNELEHIYWIYRIKECAALAISELIEGIQVTAMLLPKNPKAIDIQSIDNSFARSPWTFAIYSHPKSNERRTGRSQ